MSERNAKVIRKLARLAGVGKRVAYRFWKQNDLSIPHTQRLRPTVKFAQSLLGHLPKLPGETFGA